jgi:hypothetical protein
VPEEAIETFMTARKIQREYCDADYWIALIHMDLGHVRERARAPLPQTPPAYPPARLYPAGETYLRSLGARVAAPRPA